jgi:CubicO group peptidase (beta-lactamase class C family)
MKHWVIRCCSAAALFVMCAVPAHAADIAWPQTDIAAHAHAWFDMLRGDDAAARQFLTDHMAPSALAEADVEERLARRRGVVERTGGLTPLAIVSSTASSIDVRCAAGNGDRVVAMFAAEADAPHRIVSVRLMAQPPGDDAAPPAPAGPALSDDDAAAAIRATLDQRAAAGTWSGAALLARGGQVIASGAWGDADRAQHVRNTETTRFNVGSIGKLFTRAAVAQLAEAGKLSLDDRLSRFLPDFPDADSITIAMLCEHRSGVGDFFNDRYDHMDRSKLRHNHDYLALIRDQPLWFKPGTSERYSNGGYALLGEVIAKASGEDYYDYMAKHVWGAAGMTATGAPIEGDGTKGLAHGYTTHGATKGGEVDNVSTRPARGSAAGGSYSTIEDLLAFDRALGSATLCGRDWSAWIVGGARPDRGGRASGTPSGFGYAGGAPGLNAEWTHEGDAVLIVLTNRDPETARPTVQALQGIVRRLKPAAKRSS